MHSYISTLKLYIHTITDRLNLPGLNIPNKIRPQKFSICLFNWLTISAELILVK